MIPSTARALLRVVLPYAFFAGLWILLSDTALELLVPDPATFAKLSIYKGWAFVGVTALLLAALLRRELRKREAVYAELEHRVAERTAELAEATRAATAADRLKSAFLATMSHELRTPLNSIIGFTGLVLQELPGPLNAEQKKQLGMVRESARHLLELINDVLDISKIEAGELALASSPFDAAASLRKVSELLRPMAQAKGLGLEVSGAEAALPLVGDARRFEQILLNLASNAIKFTLQGRIALALERDPVPGRLRVRVADTGIGIAPEDMVHLFQPFRQINTGLTRTHEGTGLGLAICHRLATRMGGGIEVESRVGEGSTFTLWLPLSS